MFFEYNLTFVSCAICVSCKNMISAAFLSSSRNTMSLSSGEFNSLILYVRNVMLCFSISLQLPCDSLVATPHPHFQKEGRGGHRTAERNREHFVSFRASPSQDSQTVSLLHPSFLPSHSLPYPYSFVVSILTS